MSRTVVLAAAAVLALVGAATVAARTPATPGDVAVSRAVADRDGDHALRAEVRLTSSGPTELAVVAAGSDGHGLRVVPPEPVDGEVTVPLLGLRPASTYTVTVEAGDETVRAGTVRTRSLPDGIPPTELASEPGGPGVTLFETLYRAPEGEEGLRDEGALVAVDGAGEVVWYQRLPYGSQDITRTADGDLLATHHETGVIEVDPASGIERSWIGRSGQDATDAHGRSVARPDAVEVDTDQMHHEVLELPNGNILTLSREVREVTYPEPVCEDSAADGVERGSERTTEEVAADTVVEFAPGTGEIVREFSLWDVLDPMDHLDRLVESEFCGGYLDPRYTQGGVRDWTHANAIEVDEPRNVVWVSLRHTDQVVGLRWQDDADGPAGELVHRLGEGGTFDLTEGEWFRHQHAPEVQPDGSLLIYDNGNHRAGTSLDGAPQELPYTRAVRYQLDVAAGTATQVWEHRFPAEDEVYAPYVGDNDRLADGNVLIAHGGLLDPPSNNPNGEGVLRWARFIEVDPRTNEVVWDLRTRDPAGETGWGAYRAERLPHLYPPGWTVEPLG